jgi:hypothetical protein
MTSSALPTPTCAEDFSREWVSSVTGPHFVSKGLDPSHVHVTAVKAEKNCIQGILSTTYVVDVQYEVEGRETEEGRESPAKYNQSSMILPIIPLDEGKMSLFVKVPLRGDPLYTSVNARELCMLTQVLPKLQVSRSTYSRLFVPNALLCI